MAGHRPHRHKVLILILLEVTQMILTAKSEESVLGLNPYSTGSNSNNNK